MSYRFCIFLNMALKIVVFALVIGICKVKSQSIGCLSNQQSSLSNNQQSCGCGQQSQTIQLQPSNSNRGLKASPQLQIVPGQNCNLQAIPLSQVSQILSQGSNLQRPQTGCGCATPRQNIQVSSIPKIPSPTAQCAQPTQACACSPTVISAPVSTITIPPSNCATIIDNSLSNSLANALQMMIANDFINSAVSNNIINQDCSIPLVETSVTGFDLSNFLKTLNSNQIGCQTQTTSSCGSDEPSCYDWERLLERLRGDQCSTCGQTQTADWSAVLYYLNSQNDRCETVENEPGTSNYDYSSFIEYLRQKGQTGQSCGQTQNYNLQQTGQSCGQTQNYNLQQTGQSCGQTQNYNIQQGVYTPSSCGQTQNYNFQQGVYMPSCQCDTDSVLEALAAYLGVNPSEVCSNTYPNVAEVVFPDEIPAQLICNYGYMPTSVPVVSFSVQPIGDSSSNFVVGTKC